MDSGLIPYHCTKTQEGHNSIEAADNQKDSDHGEVCGQGQRVVTD